MRQIKDLPSARWNKGYMATNVSHKPQFYVDALDTTGADAAFPLVRAIAPEVSVDDWRDYVRRRCREGGFKVLFDANDTLIGLLSYRFGERLRHGRVLAIDDFVTFELSRAAPARAALMAAAEVFARSRGCTGLEIRVGSRGFADPSSPKVQGWLSLGLALDSVLFVRPF